MSEKVISKFLQSLIDDTETLKNIEESLKKVMVDDKVNSSDVPEIFNIVMECLDNLSKFNLSYNELPEVLSELVNYLLDHFNLVPEDEEEQFNKMIDNAIKLIMVQPKVKKGFLKAWKKLTSCCRK